MRVSIEAATAGDGPAILELLSANGLPIAGVIAHLDTAVVARDDGRLIGCAAVEVYPDGALLRSVAVSEDARNRGIGQQLAESAVELAQRRGTPAVYLLTTTAERFFPRLGFSPVARADVPAGVQESVEFRFACPASAVVMRKSLEP